MLGEIEGVRQVPDEGPRRWFSDGDMDLIVWYGPGGEEISGFQLCYDKKSVQRCLTWQRGEGGGSSSFSADGPFSLKRAARIFAAAAAGLPERERRLVTSCLTGKGEEP